MTEPVNPLRILIVDDEDSIRMVLSEFMLSLGHQVDSFPDATSAWNSALKTTYAIAFIDWTLPDISGIDLLKRLRALPDYAASILLVVTGRNNPADLEEALLAGADDYLMKPISLKLLGIRLQIAGNQRQQKVQRLKAELAVKSIQNSLEDRVLMRTVELEHANRALGMQISHRRDAEAAVKESQERLRLALDATSDGLWDWNITENTAYGSPRWFEMLGYPADAFPLTQETWLEHIHPDDIATASSALNEHLIGNTDHLEVEYRIRTKDNTWKWVLNRGRIISRSPESKPRRMVGTHADVTEQVQSRLHLESALRLESLASLAAGIAHEINQPLSALQLTLGMLEMSIEQNKPFSNSDLLAKFKWMSERSTQISEIIQHMRALARQDGNTNTINTPINDTIQRALSLLRVRLETHGIRVICQLGENLPMGKAHPLQLEQVLVNILVNALQALDDPSCSDRQILIESGTRNDSVFLIISDTGPGFGENHHKIFNPFFSTKGVGAGMGLGLSLAHSFVTSWGGSITASEGEERGAVFSITLQSARDCANDSSSKNPSSYLSVLSPKRHT